MLSLLQRNSLPSTHIRCRTTASRLATATMARRTPPPLSHPYAPGPPPARRLSLVPGVLAAAESQVRTRLGAGGKWIGFED